MTWNSQKSFNLILLLLGLATLYVLWGYLGLLFLALILVILFEPVYEWFFARIKRAGAASVLTTVVILLVLVVPLTIMISMAAQQAVETIGMVSQALQTYDWATSPFLMWVNSTFPGVSGQVEAVITAQQGQLLQIVQSTAQGLGQVVTRGVVPLVAGGTKVVIDAFIFIMAISYMLPVKQKMFAQLARLSPLDPPRHYRFVRRFEGVVRATIKSTVMVGLFQGGLGAIMLWIIGVKTAALWGLVMMIAAFVPFGAGLVVWPISIALLLSGNILAAGVWTIYSVVIIQQVDNVVRPRVLREGDAAVPELVTFIAVIGGIRAFGFLGFIIGPLIAAMFLTALDFYLEDKTAKLKPAKRQRQ